MINAGPASLLFAVTLWPWLAAFLLYLTPASRQISTAMTFAVAGGVLTPFAVWLLPGNDPLAAGCSCLVSFVPLLVLRAGDDHYVGKGMVFSFAVVGCALQALNIRDVFAVTALCGTGLVLSAWRAASRAQRASFVWDMTRSRLAGVVVAALGAAWLALGRQAGVGTETGLGGGSVLGGVFLAAGLGMMAGLGPSPVPEEHEDTAENLLEVALRFAAIVLIWRLNTAPLVREIILAAGFVTLLMMSSRRQKTPIGLLSGLVGLAAIAAAFGTGNAVVLLCFSALLLAAGPRWINNEYLLLLGAGAPPSPVFVAFLALGLALPLSWSVALFVVWLPALLRIRKDYHRAGLAMSRFDIGVLAMGLASALLLQWHPEPVWRP
ncbi:hypothetical protein D5366_01080 [Neokomagataea tanensis]|uniref:Uncharacterized protein n=1 Tax=Neokomagataea tanensis TaxID=661191 RepID=A0A4Y6V5E1_9PROT|nr:MULTISPECIES: hypothetical protein [Neokomagataea]QDH24088.1 hypothetical protein D5366_01080 [Neokomagataea tanensis]